MIRCLIPVAAALVAAALAPAASAAELQLSETQGPPFPARSFVLTLPRQAVVGAGDLAITENGQPVRNLTVTPGNQAGPKVFGVVLAIDTSLSMHGQPIADAMNAARTFAAKRSPNEQLGIIFFSHGPRVALAPTTDQGRIDQALAQVPQLSRGTRIFDAAAAAEQLLAQSHISAGSVVMLSDGADVGSQVPEGAVAAAARRTHVRIFTVGLRSASFSRSSLASLAAMADGSYAEAASSSQLAGIYGLLADRFGSEYLVRYQSLSALGSHQTVRVRVRGIPATATTTYTAPAEVLPTGPPAKVSGLWDKPWVVAVVAVLVALLLAGGIYLLVRPRPQPLQERIASFVPDTIRVEDLLPVTQQPSAQVLRVAEARLSRSRWWLRFKEDIDVGEIRIEPIRLVLGSLVICLAGLALSVGALHNAPLAVLFLLFPVGVHLFVRFKAERQRRAFDEQLPDNLQVIASAMRAGQSFVGAMSTAADDAAQPSQREFQRVVADEQLGIPLAEAMRTVAERMRSTEFEYVGLVAMLQRETGGNTAEVIDRVTETIRERAGLRRLVRTLTAQGRFSGGVVSLLPVGMLGIISIIRPSYLTPMLHNTWGVVALVLAAVAMALGWFAIRKIVDIRV